MRVGIFFMILKSLPQEPFSNGVPPQSGTELHLTDCSVGGESRPISVIKDFPVLNHCRDTDGHCKPNWPFGKLFQEMFKLVYFTLKLRTAEEKERGEEEGLVPLYKFFCQGTRNTCNPAGVPSGKTMKIHGHRMSQDAILLSSYSLVLTFLISVCTTLL